MKTIKIPKGLSEDELVEFIQEEVRKVGGDPDTLYPISFDDYNDKVGDHVCPIPETFEVKFDYGFGDRKEEPLQVTFVEDKDPEYESVKKFVDMWTKAIRNTENGLER